MRVLGLKGHILLLMTAAVAASLSAQAPKRVRRIAFDGAPIATQLKDDDQVVVVSRVTDSINFGNDVDSFIATTSSFANIVATIVVRQATGVLVNNDAWVSTRIVGVVDRVIKQTPPWHLTRGDTVEFWRGEGITNVGAIEVRTNEAFDFATGSTYLILLRASDGELGEFLPPLLISGGRLRNVTPARTRTFLLDGLRLDDFARKAARFK